MKIRVVGSKDICPFDKKPCAYVSSCDDALSLAFGIDLREGRSCPRAVFKARKK